MLLILLFSLVLGFVIYLLQLPKIVQQNLQVVAKLHTYHQHYMLVVSILSISLIIASIYYSLVYPQFIALWHMCLSLLLLQIILLDYYFRLIDLSICLYLQVLLMLGIYLEIKSLVLSNILFSMLLASCSIGSVSVFAYLIYRKTALAYADCLLFIILTAYLDVAMLPIFLLITALLGIIYFLIFRQRTLPFASCTAVAFLYCWYFL